MNPNLPFLRVVLIACTAYVAYLSGKEYVQVSMRHQVPSHPFGRLEKWSSMADDYVQSGISARSVDYSRFMLSLCLGAGAVSALLVMGWFVEKLLRYAYMSLVVFALYLAWHKFLN
jgi:hypothetical protein